MRRFVEREVLPVVAERERADDYPGDLLPALARLGVLGMSIPEEHGGSAIDLVGYALVFEELARGWMGLASVVGSSQSGCWLLGRFGTDEQQQRFLPDLAAGRRMSGIALTEPATGSDLKAITLRAERRGDAYLVNGTKTMITQARHADPLVLLAVTDPTVTPAHRGMSLLLVEQGTPGWTVGRDITKLGHKGVELCELAFDDAVVPAANLLGGTEGSGLSQMLAALDRGRIYMAAASVGIAHAALEGRTRYATERRRGEHVHDGDVLQPLRRADRHRETGELSPPATAAASVGERPALFWPSVKTISPATCRPAASSRTLAMASPICVLAAARHRRFVELHAVGSTPSCRASREKDQYRTSYFFASLSRNGLACCPRGRCGRASPGSCG